MALVGSAGTEIWPVGLLTAVLGYLFGLACLAGTGRTGAGAGGLFVGGLERPFPSAGSGGGRAAGFNGR